jgi:ribosomal-protein-alanine N-acetyltransferase
MSSQSVTLRLAEPHDAQAIAFMSRDLVEAGLGWKYDAARVLRAIRERDTVTLVACEGGQVIGFAIMEFGDERAHLVLLAVRPTQRRGGIGRQLLQWLLESARTAGIGSVHLELRAQNEAARAFYRAMGFSESVLVPGYYRGREAALRMLRVLRVPGPPPFVWQPPALGQK